MKLKLEPKDQHTAPVVEGSPATKNLAMALSVEVSELLEIFHRLTTEDSERIAQRLPVEAAD